MMQVDVFWSYGLSAGLALAAGPHLKNEASFWRNPYFTLSMLWTAALFAPSGMYLLWNFPGWETMFVAKAHDSIPAWLVALFAATNVTQGALGFYFTWRALRRGQDALAKLQTMVAHACMLFILIVGWDGTGYRRFLYAGTGEDWHAGVQYSWTAFFSSPVFFTLLSMGAVLVPSYIWLGHRFRKGL